MLNRTVRTATLSSIFALAPLYAQELPPNPVEAGLDAIVALQLASQPPTFDPGEQVGLCLVESALSLIAAHTDVVGCPDPALGERARVFDLDVLTGDVAGGLGGRAGATAVIDAGVDAGGTSLVGVLSSPNVKGVLCNVNQAEGSNALQGVRVAAYTGNHAWSRRNTIFLDNADPITLIDPQSGVNLNYDEHSIKDFFKQIVDGQAVEFDWGLEVITKDAFPRTKWTELSAYRRENGAPGALQVEKHLIEPRSAASCRITYVAEGFNGGSEFDYVGQVTVQRDPPPPAQ